MIVRASFKGIIRSSGFVNIKCLYLMIWLFAFVIICPAVSSAVCNDNDNDGYGNPGSVECDNGSAEDCDDNNPARYPGNAEVLCNGVDENCNGLSDDDRNNDGDPVSMCNGDCDDSDPTRYPGNAEVLCNGIDENCNGPGDDDRNDDGDPVSICRGDCDDNDPARYPGNVEILCNSIDENCDNIADFGPDIDNDGIVECNDSCPSDPDNDADDDGICGDIDNCPDENAAIRDGNGDGCLDNVCIGPATLEAELESMLSSLGGQIDVVPDADDVQSIQYNFSDYTISSGSSVENLAFFMRLDSLTIDIVYLDMLFIVTTSVANIDTWLPLIDNGDGTFRVGDVSLMSTHINITGITSEEASGFLLSQFSGAIEPVIEQVLEDYMMEQINNIFAGYVCEGDMDNDGIPDAFDSCLNDAFNDGDGDGLCQSEGDCDDSDPNNYPGNTEVCDVQDNNCDTIVDDVSDTDGDGIGDCFDSCPAEDATIRDGNGDGCLDDVCLGPDTLQAELESTLSSLNGQIDVVPDVDDFQSIQYSFSNYTISGTTSLNGIQIYDITLDSLTIDILYMDMMFTVTASYATIEAWLELIDNGDGTFNIGDEHLVWTVMNITDITSAGAPDILLTLFSDAFEPVVKQVLADQVKEQIHSIMAGYSCDDDNDSDGIPNSDDNCPNDALNDGDGDGVCQSEGDCDDSDPNNYPGNTEVCDGQDNNCDTIIDDVSDTDGDGIGDCFDSCPAEDATIRDGDGDGCLDDVCIGPDTLQTELESTLSSLNGQIDVVPDASDFQSIQYSFSNYTISGTTSLNGIQDYDITLDSLTIDILYMDTMFTVTASYATIEVWLELIDNGDGTFNIGDEHLVWTVMNITDITSAGAPDILLTLFSDAFEPVVKQVLADQVKEQIHSIMAGYLCDDDNDSDGIPNSDDNCPDISNPDQADSDGDGAGNACDVCPDDNPDDSDSDGICESDDLCPGVDDNQDADGDGVPDGCDLCLGDDGLGDSDSDGICDDLDNCPDDPAKTEAGLCGCGLVDTDTDSDSICDDSDNCAGTANPDQADTDGDGVGDACDADESALFDHGLFTDQDNSVPDIVMSGGSYVNSYDDTGHDFDPDNPFPLVGTNSDTVNVYDSSMVYGVIVTEAGRTYPAKTPPAVFDELLKGTRLVSGLSGWLQITDTSFSLVSSAVAEIYGGVYGLDNFLVANSGTTLRVHGDVILYVTNSFRVTSKARITLEPGATLTVYVDEYAVISNDGTFINEGGNPADVVIYGTDVPDLDGDGNPKKVGIYSKGSLTGVIYAPDHRVEITTMGELFGAAIANDALLASSGRLHYYMPLAESTRYSNILIDADGDGYDVSVDCDDTDPSIYPKVWYEDMDGDGYSNGNSVVQCDAPAGYREHSDPLLLALTGDCDDSDAALNPDTLWYQDYDEDGFGTSSIYLQQCAQPGGTIAYVLDNTDYDDHDGTIGAPVRIERGEALYFRSISDAYDAAQDGETLQAAAVTFTEDLTFDRDITVTIEGGCKGDFTDGGGMTVVDGDMTIRSGALIVRDVDLQ